MLESEVGWGDADADCGWDSRVLAELPSLPLLSPLAS